MRKFNRVGDQIVDHLPDGKGIAQDDGRLIDFANIELHATLMGIHPVFLNAIAQQGRQINGQPLKRKCLNLKLLHQKYIIDQP